MNLLPCQYCCKLSLVILLLVGGLTTPPLLEAQITPPVEQGPDRILRLSLAHLADPLVPGPHISYEHRLARNIYLRHELGYLIDYDYPDQEALQKLNGFRIRTARRKYASNPGLIRRRFFHELSFDYRYLNALIAGDFMRGGFGGFNQRINYGITQHSFSFHYIRGVSIVFGEHWQLDTGAGIGMRINNRTYGEVPEGASFITNGSLFWQYGLRQPWHATLSVPLIIALGYQF